MVSLISSLAEYPVLQDFLDFVFHKNWEYTRHGISGQDPLSVFTIKSIPAMYERLEYEVLLHQELIPPNPSVRYYSIG